MKNYMVLYALSNASLYVQIMWGYIIHRDIDDPYLLDSRFDTWQQSAWEAVTHFFCSMEMLGCAVWSSNRWYLTPFGKQCDFAVSDSFYVWIPIED